MPGVDPSGLPLEVESWVGLGSCSCLVSSLCMDRQFIFQ